MRPFLRFVTCGESFSHPDARVPCVASRYFWAPFGLGCLGFLFGGGAGDLFWDLFGLEIQIFVLNLCQS